MTTQQPKLLTKVWYAVAVLAVAGGASLSLVRDYWTTGAVGTQSIVISLVTFGVGVAIVVAVGWWGNRPEPGGRDE